MILGGPKDTITSLRTKGLKALVPPNSFGPPTMVAVVVDFKDRGLHIGQIPSDNHLGPSHGQSEEKKLNSLPLKETNASP